MTTMNYREDSQVATLLDSDDFVKIDLLGLSRAAVVNDRYKTHLLTQYP